ncbi:VanZ family protein [Sinomonas atrocyanea]|uniref:VanZ family protein n=1 Tax=Sinomonas atrocyanea TaxID=37927 RepID=UPI00278B33F7|nr:VanZ family protein [Sinomonas atrocyanea]MDP9883353.1 VanZ family protein [Sinomonas atrocyanea]
MRRRAVLWVLGVYCALLAVLVFSPVGPSLRGVPLPAGVRAGEVEAAANVLVFVPLGFLVAQLLPRGRRWLAVPFCCLTSTSIEVVQALFISTRLGTPRDVFTNTTGALVGYLLFTASRWIRVHRPQPAARGGSVSERSSL